MVVKKDRRAAGNFPLVLISSQSREMPDEGNQMDVFI
jgi:hypothetical protein